MENKLPLFTIKYSIICLILFAGGIIGKSFSCISLGFFYFYLSLVFILEPDSSGTRKYNMIYSGVFVVFLSVCLIVFLHVLTKGLKYAVSMYEYRIEPIAVYAAVCAGVFREIGRMSFIEKKWRYLYPGLLVFITTSTAWFIPELAAADLFVSLGIFLLTFVLGFITSFKIVQKLFSDY